MRVCHLLGTLALTGCLWAQSYRIQTVAGGTFAGDGGPATAGLINFAQGIAVDRLGNVYIADSEDHRVRKVSTDGRISTIAGTGIAGFSGDGGPGAEAQLNFPYGVAVDGSGNVFIADIENARVRKVTSSGQIS